MVTTAATPAQAAYFRHNRSSLFGQLQPDGTIHKISPLTPPRRDLPRRASYFETVAVQDIRFVQG
jgi:hypothetical protein